MARYDFNDYRRDLQFRSLLLRRCDPRYSHGSSVRRCDYYFVCDLSERTAQFRWQNRVFQLHYWSDNHCAECPRASVSQRYSRNAALCSRPWVSDLCWSHHRGLLVRRIVGGSPLREKEHVRLHFSLQSDRWPQCGCNPGIGSFDLGTDPWRVAVQALVSLFAACLRHLLIVDGDYLSQCEYYSWSLLERYANDQCRKL